MNLHFEDRQKLHALAQPVEPQRDLWAGIAARIETRSRAPHRRMQWMTVAASLTGVAILSGAIGFGLYVTAPRVDRQQAGSYQAKLAAAADSHSPRWKPNDPRLRGAAVELRAAQGELQQALAIAPHSEYLQRLLQSTERQQSRLRLLDLDAG